MNSYTIINNRRANEWKKSIKSFPRKVEKFLLSIHEDNEWTELRFRKAFESPRKVEATQSFSPDTLGTWNCIQKFSIHLFSRRILSDSVQYFRHTNFIHSIRGTCQLLDCDSDWFGVPCDFWKKFTSTWGRWWWKTRVESLKILFPQISDLQAEFNHRITRDFVAAAQRCCIRWIECSITHKSFCFEFFWRKYKQASQWL